MAKSSATGRRRPNVMPRENRQHARKQHLLGYRQPLIANQAKFFDDVVDAELAYCTADPYNDDAMKRRWVDLDNSSTTIGKSPDNTKPNELIQSAQMLTPSIICKASMFS